MMNLRKGRAARVAAGLLAAVTCQIALAATITPMPKGASISIAGGSLQLTLVRSNVLRVHFLPGGHATPPGAGDVPSSS